MAINEDGVLQLSRGTIFTAPAETPLPGDLTKFTLDTDKLEQWENLGDLSGNNKVSFSTDGGDATTMSTWRRAKARIIYSDTTGTLTGNSVQLDAATVKTIYNGWDGDDGGIIVSLTRQEQKLALFILSYDSNADKYFGIYMPNTSFTWKGLPDFSSDNFTEVSFTASTLDSITLKKSASGKRGTFAFYDSTHFASGPVSVESVSLTPATATVNVDKTVDLTVGFTPANATDKTFTAVSSDPTKATVAVNGSKVVVTGNATTDTGKTVTITVTSTDGRKTATCALTVAPEA